MSEKYKKYSSESKGVKRSNNFFAGVNGWTSDSFFIAIIVVLVVIAYVLGLFIDLTGDAGKYAAIARNMIESGDWINLKIYDEPYDQKPPLLFWLVSLGFKIGGLENWAFKIFPLIYSIFGVWVTFKLGETLYNKNTGWLAAIMLATSCVYFMFTMDVHTDLILQTNVTLAIWQLAVYLNTRKPINFVLAFVGVGLAMMSKGPVGAAIPAFSLLTHLLLKRDFKQLIHPKWLLGILIAILINIPTFAGLYNQFGIDGLKFYFFTNNVGRITGSYVGSNNDYLFYIHTLLYLLLPWSILFLFAFSQEIKSYVKPGGQKTEYLTAGGIWIFFVVLSIARGKAPHYIFSLIPMIFVVVAKWVNLYIEKHKQVALKRLIIAQNTVPVLLLLVSGVVMAYFFPTTKIVFWILLLVATGVYVYFLFPGHSPNVKIFLPSAMVMAVLMVCFNGHALPAAYKYQSSRKASETYNSTAANNSQLYNYLYDYHELFFYSKNKVKQLNSISEFIPDTVKASWLFTTEIGKDSLYSDYNHLVEEVYSFKHQGMSKLRPKFFNPETRQDALKNTYLIKIGPEKQ